MKIEKISEHEMHKLSSREKHLNEYFMKRFLSEDFSSK